MNLTEPNPKSQLTGSRHGGSRAAGDPETSAIDRVLDAIAAGYRDRDAATIAGNYAPDVRIADLAPPLLRRGFDGLELQAWLDGWDAPVETVWREREVTWSGDLALCHGLMQTSTSRAGEPVAWWSRITTALARRADGWRVIHEHTSVPFHMDGSFRAAIDLEP